MYHVLNRAVARLPLFRKEADYAPFEWVMMGAYERDPTRNLARCMMRSQWHFVFQPRRLGPAWIPWHRTRKGEER